MRTITTTTNIYKYGELNADAQDKVKQWYLDNFRDNEYFSDEIVGMLEIVFGKNNLDVEYSLGYCQGDGLNIYGDISVYQILDAADKKEKWTLLFDDFNKMLTDSDKENIRAYAVYCDTIHVPRNNSNYCFCVADQIDYFGECKSALESAGFNVIHTDAIEHFNDAIIHLFKDVCEDYELWGYSYFYEVDDIDIMDGCEANGWEFTEDGELYNG